MKVLLIDDDAAILRAIARLLGRTHEVHTVADAADAVARIRAQRPDVIVCDLNLVGMSGLDVHAAVREEDPESARRFVFISGDRDPGLVNGLLGGLPNQWIQKPFGLAPLLAAIARFEPRRPSGGSKGEVLVVEDDVVINDCLCECLHEDAYSSSSATTLYGARSQLLVSKPVCMLLDLNLPDGTGETLLSELTVTGLGPPCVLVSAAREAPRVAARFGIPLVRKPFCLDKLLAVVATAIEQASFPFDVDPICAA